MLRPCPVRHGPVPTASVSLRLLTVHACLLASLAPLAAKENLPRLVRFSDQLPRAGIPGAEAAAVSGSLTTNPLPGRFRF